MVCAAFQLMDVGFEVSCDHPVVGAHLVGLFDGCRPLTEGRPVHQRVCIESADDDWAIEVNDRTTLELVTPEAGVGPAVWQVNRVVLDAFDGLGLHGGVVDFEGVRVLASGASGAGKSTLTTALCRAGASYGSDEALCVDWTNERAVPFPKPISLDPGSWELFPDLEPVLDLPNDYYKSTQWQVAPSRLGAVSNRSAPPRLVVFRQYLAGQPTRVEHLSRAETIAGLARETHRLTDHKARALHLLEQITRDTTAIRVTGGDLDEAVEAVLSEAAALASG